MSSVAQAAGTIFGGLIGFIVGGPAGAVKGAALGYSLFAPRSGSSPTYSFGSTYNTRSHELAVPVIYGRNRVAGNTIFEKISGDKDEKIALQIGVSEGPIKSINEIKCNDIGLIELGLEVGGISHSVKLGERTQTADPINDQGQTFPYLAYISAQLTANEFLSGSPTITSIVEGRIIKVWNGSSWTESYNNNPAWCILDFLTNNRYGLGIDEQFIDLDSFINTAEHCNGLVPDGNGGQEKRFQLDYVLDAKKSSLDYIKEMLATFAGFLIYSQGEIRLNTDGPGAPTQYFDMDNIIENSFSYSKASRKDIYNRVKVQYIDPDEHWEKIFAQYSLDSDIRKNRINEIEIPLLGISRFSQAGRMARFYQKKSWFCNTFCQFMVGINDLECEAGDIIAVTHEAPGWVEKEFRVLEIHELENDEMRLICQEYNIAVYSDDGVVRQIKKDTELPNPFAFPASVMNLSLIEQAKILGDGTWVPGIKVAWDKPNNIFWRAGLIYVSSDEGATWHFIQRVEGTEFLIDNLAPGTYKVRVVSENNHGIKQDFSLAATGQITVAGKDVEPSDVTWADCSFIDRVILRWNSVPDTDLDEYEVRFNANFGSDDEFLVYRGKGLSFTLDRPAQRQYTFYMKAKDRSGNYSKNATPKIVENAVPSTPPQPIITEFFSSLWIEIRPVSDNDILGYNLYMTPCDAQGNPNGDTQVTTYPTPQRITYQAEVKSSFLVQVAAFDILGEGEKCAPVLARTRTIDEVAAFAQNVTFPKIVDELPELPSDEYPADSLVVLSTDHQLYRSTGTEWDNSVSTEQLVGKITAGMIAAGAIGAAEIAAQSLVADHFAAGSIEAYVAAVKEAFIDSAKIISIEADKIKVGGSSAPIPLAISPTDTLFRFDGSLLSTQGLKPLGME